MLPDVPTFTETGFPKADFSAWFCLFAPAGTPELIIAQPNKQVVAAVNVPDVRRLEDAGFTILGATPENASKMIAVETMRWKQVIAATGFRGD